MKTLLKPWIARLGIYPLAAGLYETWRLLARPHTHGALVAIWDQGRLLLVQASYRRCLSLPGGGIARNEPPRQAAVRELAEELGLTVSEQDLGEPWGVSECSARGRNTVWIFPLDGTKLAAKGTETGKGPRIQPDGLEIVACHWLTREQALSRPVTSHLRDYLQ